MKVLQVLQALHAGGAEGFATNLAVNLTLLGVDTRVFLLGGVRRERGRLLLARLEEAGVEVIGVEERKLATVGNLLRLAEVIRSWVPDIVQANIYSAEVASAMAKAISLKTGPLLVRRLASTKQSQYRSRIARLSLDRFYQLRIACSPAVAAAYRESGYGQADGEVETILNGARLLDRIPDRENRSAARQHLGLSEGSFVVAHIGRMLGCSRKSGPRGLAGEPKAQDVLLKSFAQAFRGDSDASLICVGDGPLRPEAEALSRSLGIAGQTRFLGEQPEPWLAIKAADVFCFPSRYEGLPNALIEAASCGLPIVASDIPEIRTLSPGEAWELVPVDDIPRFAEALRVVRAELGSYAGRALAAAREFRSRFSMKACAERYLSAYENVLQRTGRTSFERTGKAA